MGSEMCIRDRSASNQRIRLDTMADERSPEHLSTLAKGLSVLTSFSRENPSMTLSEVAKRTGLNPAVARRLLQKC